MFFKIFIKNYEKKIFTDSSHYIHKINNHLIILWAMYIALSNKTNMTNYTT